MSYGLCVGWVVVCDLWFVVWCVWCMGFGVCDMICGLWCLCVVVCGLVCGCGMVYGLRCVLCGILVLLFVWFMGCGMCVWCGLV